MATMVRREKPSVPKEQRDVWLGHDEKRTANAYEAFDPEYLRDCMQATESGVEWWRDRFCTPNTLSSPRNGAFAPFVRPTPQSDPWRHDRGRIVS